MVFTQMMRKNSRISFMIVNLNNVQLSKKFSSYEVPKERINEPITQKRARLLYQSRKRGMLENGLLLSTFANKYLNSLSPELMEQYDKVINLPSNDWDLYYWLIGKEPTPPEYNNEIMSMLKKHVKNEQKESRIRQPDL